MAAFDTSEHDRRRTSVQAALRRRGVAAALLFDTATAFYLTGVSSASVGQLQAVLLTAENSVTLFARDFEIGNVVAASVDDVITYSWFDDPIAHLAALLQERGLARERLAVDLRSQCLSAASLERLQGALPGAVIEDAFGTVEESRLRKSAAELSYMREAARLTDESVAVGFAAARPGVRDSDVAAAIFNWLYAHGSEPIVGGQIVAAGPNAGIGHSSFTGRRLETGDTVFLEYSAQVNHYVAPVMRTAVLGRPTPEQAEFRDAGLAAINAVLASARPGVPASEVAQRALACLEPVRDRIHFHGLVAYPVGLGFPPSRYEHLGHELKEGNDRPLEDGMAFHVVMSLRKFAEFGVSQSHTVVVTKEGCEPLTKSSAALAELPV